MLRRTLACLVFVLAVLVLAPVPVRSSADQPAADSIRVEWVADNWLLIRWRQHDTAADRVLVYSCPDEDAGRCVVVAELYGVITGPRTATAWGQPGQYVRLAEFTFSAPNTYAWRSLSEPVLIPPHQTALPVVRSAPQ